MVASSAIRERDFLQTLVPGYEAEGFSVFLHPAREMLPPFMRGYQPDAIAVKDDEKIAIEIKRDGPSARSSTRRCAGVGKRAHHRPAAGIQGSGP
jgi:hypothetical protein